jgi:hypothetical protein
MIWSLTRGNYLETQKPKRAAECDAEGEAKRDIYGTGAPLLL